MFDNQQEHNKKYRLQLQNTVNTRAEILQLLTLKKCIYQYQNTADEIRQQLQLHDQQISNIPACRQNKSKKRKNHRRINPKQTTDPRIEERKNVQSERCMQKYQNVQPARKQLLKGSSQFCRSKHKHKSEHSAKKIKNNYNSIQFRAGKGNADLGVVYKKARTFSHLSNKNDILQYKIKEKEDKINNQLKLKAFIAKYRSNYQRQTNIIRETDLQHKKIEELVNQIVGLQDPFNELKEENNEPIQTKIDVKIDNEKINQTVQIRPQLNSRLKNRQKQQPITGLLKQRYQIIQKIGKGLSGQVYKGKDILSERLVAIKVSEQQQNKQRQYQFYKKVQHKNIVNYLNNFVQNGKRYLILQYFPHTLDTLSKQRKLQQQQIKKIFKNIVSGLIFLHGLSIAHRDIKMENIVCTEDLSTVKFIDFGLCIDLNEQNSKLSKQFCGTMHYMPPQILQKRAYDPKKADIWSLGVLLYKLTFDRYPFRGKDERQISHKMVRSKLVFPEYCNQDMKGLLQSMLMRNPMQRSSISDVIEHRWMV